MHHGPKLAIIIVVCSVGAPRRLGLLIEGESLLNDGTAIVVFGVLVDALATRAELDVAAAGVDNHMRGLPHHRHLGRDGRMRWLADGRVLRIGMREPIALGAGERLFLATGSLNVDGTSVHSPAFIAGDHIVAESGVVAVVLPRLDDAPSEKRPLPADLLVAPS